MRTEYDDIVQLSNKAKDGNGNLVICFKEKSGAYVDIASLDWEAIIDASKALDLASKVFTTKLISLNLPDVWWANNFKHFGECLEETRRLFGFLADWFVGSFDY